MKTQTIAAIDIGSNSLKLVIVEAAASDSFTVIGAGTRTREARTRNSAQSFFVRRSVKSFGRRNRENFAQSPKRAALTRFSPSPPRAVREAENAAEFVDEILRRTGVKIEVLSSMEEARLIGVAVSQYFNAENSSLLNIDIGGGSTELSLMREKHAGKTCFR